MGDSGVGHLASMKKKLNRVFWRVLMKMMTQERRRRYEERSLRRRYERLLAQATGDDYLSLRSEYDSYRWDIERNRREDGDIKLIRKARHYNVPIPPRREEDGLWDECGAGDWLLTEKGTHQLQKEIRAEQMDRLALSKARRDVILGWLPFITAVIGLIGALMGLVSLFRN